MNNYDGDPSQRPAPQSEDNARTAITDSQGIQSRPVDALDSQPQTQGQTPDVEAVPAQPARRHRIVKLLGTAATAGTRVANNTARVATSTIRSAGTGAGKAVQNATTAAATGLRRRAEERREQERKKMLADVVTHRRGGTEDPRIGHVLAIDATLDLIASYNLHDPDQRRSAANALRAIIYNHANIRDLQARYSSKEDARTLGDLGKNNQMETKAQDADHPLNPANVQALRMRIVDRALKQAQETARNLGQEHPTPDQEEVARGQALLSLRHQGVNALTAEELARYIGMDPETLMQQSRNHRVPLETAILLDQLSAMMRLDAAGLLKNQNREPSDRVPEDQASPLNILLPEDQAQRNVVLTGAANFVTSRMPTQTAGGRNETEGREFQFDPDVQQALNLVETDPLLLGQLDRQELQRLYYLAEVEAHRLAAYGARDQAMQYQPLLKALHVLMEQKADQERVAQEQAEVKAAEAHRKQLEAEAAATRRAQEKTARNIARQSAIIEQAQANQTRDKRQPAGADQQDDHIVDATFREVANEEVSQDSPIAAETDSHESDTQPAILQLPPAQRRSSDKPEIEEV